MNKEALINQFLSMRAAIDAALSILAGEEEQECKHQKRQNLTTMGGPEHWICKDCGYEYIEKE